MRNKDIYIYILTDCPNLFLERHTFTNYPREQRHGINQATRSSQFLIGGPNCKVYIYLIVYFS
jgi:hypothetical protein